MFERLTHRSKYGIAYTKIAANESNMVDVGECYTGRIIDHLASYEDSGLSPEQVQELAQAKGKDVVCHCNIKKNAELIAEILDYDVENEIAISLSLEEMKTYINAYEDYRELKEQGRLIVLPCQIGQKAWYIKDGNIDYGFARWFEESDGKWYASVQNEPKSMLFFEFDDFGKTIFLTRKAAEEALRKEQSYE